MKRKRHRETKVWHDPHLTAVGRRNKQGKEESALPSEERQGRDGRRRKSRRTPDSTKRSARIVTGRSADNDPREAERERLLDRLLNAEGRSAISKASKTYLDAGFELPRMQDVWLQLLEHNNEETVMMAIEQLTEILSDEPPKRRAVLESRLRRIEEFADEQLTQNAASGLRRLLSSGSTAAN